VVVSPTTTTTNTPDLFDQFDSNHDHMIDRTEYDQGMTNVVSQLQWMAGPPQGQGRSFTTWLMEDIFSYDTSSAAAAATGGASASSSSSSSTANTKVISIWYGFWKAFTSSVMMILATEIGDKTFFIAAILSMKHSRTLVFTGAILALILMTIISTGMGLILPKFLDRKYTHLLSAILFLYFGCKLLYDSRNMEHGKVSEELEEVEEELLHNPTKSKKNKKKGDDDDIEVGGTSSSNNNNSSNMNSSNHRSTATHHLLSTYSILMMALTLTFVAEWGDRSQIATIALASAKNPLGVTMGSIIGHCICTASACIGGRILASNISEKTVSQYGGIIFLLFGLHSLFFES
jgi:Ca2+/H+ antiporter, TMEM165/GDT1 family